MPLILALCMRAWRALILFSATSFDNVFAQKGPGRQRIVCGLRVLNWFRSRHARVALLVLHGRFRGMASVSFLESKTRSRARKEVNGETG